MNPPPLFSRADIDIINGVKANNIFDDVSITNDKAYNANKYQTVIKPNGRVMDNDTFNMKENIASICSHEYSHQKNCENENINKSDSLFEKIYKDFNSTFRFSSDQIFSSNDLREPSVVLYDFGIENKTISDDKCQVNDVNDYDKVNDNNKDLFGNIFDKYKSIVVVQSKESVIPTSKEKKVPVHKNKDEKRILTNSIRMKTHKKKHKSNATMLISNTFKDNKYMRSPFIVQKSNHLRQSSSEFRIGKSFEVVNPSLRNDIDHHFLVYRPRLKCFVNNQFSSSTESVCAFCGKNSGFLNLGPLFGPYFIDEKSLLKLPQKCLFPTNEIGLLCEAEKNTSAVVIQSSNISKNGSVTDFRITTAGEIWLHRECVLWAPGTFLRGDGTIGGLADALSMALEENCFVCNKVGAILNCTTRNCERNFHYYCALSKGCELNTEQFSMVCNVHVAR